MPNKIVRTTPPITSATIGHPNAVAISKLMRVPNRATPKRKTVRAENAIPALHGPSSDRKFSAMPNNNTININTINNIREEMPYEIRMNMFLIKCSDINNGLVDECEQLIEKILNKIADHVFVKMAPDISGAIKTIQEELNKKSDTSADLVKHEKHLDDVKNIEHKKLKAQYADMIEWLMFLNKNPKYKMSDESMKPIQTSFKFMN